MQLGQKFSMAFMFLHFWAKGFDSFVLDYLFKDIYISKQCCKSDSVSLWAENIFVSWLV